MVAWGDSLTAGAGSTGGSLSTNAFPYRLGLLLGGRAVANKGIGGETSTDIMNRLIPASLSLRSQPTIIWAGRNNYHDSATVQSDIATMVAALGHTRYLVLSVLNSTTAGIGTSGYDEIIALNAALAATYGTRYVDVRSYLVSQYNPNDAQDITDHANDVPPTSLHASGDTLHLNNAGYQAVADFVYAHRGHLGLE